MRTLPAQAIEPGLECRLAVLRAAALAIASLLLGAWCAAVAGAQTPVAAAPTAAPATPAITTPAASTPAEMLPEIKPLYGAEAPRYMRQLAKQLRAAIEGTPVELSTARGDVLKLLIPVSYLFGLDAAQLRTEGPGRLYPLIAALVKWDRTGLVVVGHTDTLGSRESNAAWSLRRAAAVADYLQSQGIAPSRLGTRGAGELELRDKTEDTPEARERNRRIEIEVRPARPSSREAS